MDQGIIDKESIKFCGELYVCYELVIRQLRGLLVASYHKLFGSTNNNL